MLTCSGLRSIFELQNSRKIYGRKIKKFPHCVSYLSVAETNLGLDEEDDEYDRDRDRLGDRLGLRETERDLEPDLAEPAGLELRLRLRSDILV